MPIKLLINVMAASELIRGNSLNWFMLAAIKILSVVWFYGLLEGGEGGSDRADKP
jgi:hypothetical protein